MDSTKTLFSAASAAGIVEKNRFSREGRFKKPAPAIRQAQAIRQGNANRLALCGRYLAFATRDVRHGGGLGRTLLATTGFARTDAIGSAEPKASAALVAMVSKRS